jgi:hypothetical protein
MNSPSQQDSHGHQEVCDPRQVCGDALRRAVEGKRVKLGTHLENTCVRQGCIVACQSPSTLRKYKQQGALYPDGSKEAYIPGVLL